MRKIGLIGGSSWESTLEYYRILNQLIGERLGYPHSAELVICSMDFAKLVELQEEEDWDGVDAMLAGYAASLKAAGAECVLLCANTLHKSAEALEKAAILPLLHIGDITGRKIKENGLSSVGLLGTRITMEGDFYARRIERGFGLKIITPQEAEREKIQNIIYKELIQGIIKDSSRDILMNIISSLAKRGAEGIILGCTELPLLIRNQDASLPLFDTLRLHAEAAADWALGN